MKPKVLMLGWEHPPYYNGGLGIASTALAESLQVLVDLRMIVPKSGITSTSPAYELIGLNTVNLPPRSVTIEKELKQELKEVEIEYVEVDLQGYAMMSPAFSEPHKEKTYLKLTRTVTESQEYEGPFDLEELYGDNLLDKVLEYTEIVREMARKWDFDIIHAHDWMTFLAGLQLKAITKKPLILHIHSLQYDRSGPSSRDIIYQIERHAMSQADAIIPVSQYTADIISKFYGIDQENIYPIHNGLSKEDSFRIAKPFDEDLVVFLGRLTGQKGPAYFFKAAEKILEERKDVRFILAGKGELIEELIQEAAEKRLGDRIHFTGFLEPDRVKDLLAMADVYVMPSVSEPFGLSALEAAHMGVPVIISETTGVGEVLKHAEVVNYTETEELAGRISSLLDNPLMRQRIVDGQLMDIDSLGWDKTAETVFSLYRSLLQQEEAPA